MRPTGHTRARGIVSSRESGDRVRAWRYAPGPALSEVLECGWAGQWDLRNQAPHHNEMLADPCAHFVVETGPQGPHARFVGIWTRRWTRTMQDWGKVWGLKLHAGALGAVTEVPAHQLCNQILDLESMGFSKVTSLLQDVVAAPDHAQAFACFESWLQVHLRPLSSGTRQAIAALARVHEDSELMRVESWAAEIGTTVRGLQRLFRMHVGASPKWVLRRVRLQEAALQMERAKDGQVPFSLTDLAHRLGYSDHPHLCRDFKRAVGKTPSEFMRQL